MREFHSDAKRPSSGWRCILSDRKLSGVVERM
jgi:hypothetical protein